MSLSKSPLPVPPPTPQQGKTNLWIVVGAMILAMVGGAILIVSIFLLVLLKPAQTEDVTAHPNHLPSAPSPPTPIAQTRPITTSTVAGIRPVRQLDEGVVGAAVYAPDGHTLAVANGPTIQLYQATTLDMLATLTGGHEHDINALAFSSPTDSSGGGLLLASSAVNEHVIQVWDVQSRQRVWSFDGHQDWIRSLAFSPDGSTLASGSADTTIKLWDTRNGTLLRSLEGHTDMVNQVCFSPDGTLLASTSRDGSVRLWDTSRGTVFHTLPFFEPTTDTGNGATFWTTGLAFSPDGTLLVAGSTDGSVRVLSVLDSSLVQTFVQHAGSLVVMRGIAFSPDGKTLASLSLDGRGYLWDPHTGAVQASFTHNDMEVLGLSWHPNGETLITSSSMSGEVWVWDTTTGKLHRRLPLAHGPAVSLVYAPGGNILGTGGRNGVVRLRNLNEDTQVMLAGVAPTTNPLAFVNDHELVVAVQGNPGSAVLYDLTHTQDPQTLMFVLGPASSVGVGADGTLVALGNDKGEITLWDMPGGVSGPVLTGIGGKIQTMVFDRSGTFLAASNDGEDPSADIPPVIGVWESKNGTLLHTLTGHRGRITGLAMQPGGSLIASSSEDGTLRLWNREDGTEVRVLRANSPQEHVTCVAFSPDGSLLAAGNPYGGITFWDPSSGDEISTLETHGGAVLAIAFRPDAKQLAVSGEQGGVWLFENRNP